MINTILKAELNKLAWELSNVTIYVFPESFDFFNTRNPRAKYFKGLAVRAYEVIHDVEIIDD